MFNQLAVQADEHMLRYEKDTQQPLSRGQPLEISEQSTSRIPMPPLQIPHCLLHTINGVSVGHHPACRAAVQHCPLRPRPPPEPPPARSDTHYAALWEDVRTHLFTSFAGGSFGSWIFFFEDRPQGPHQGTTNGQPPTANRHQPPTANWTRRPTANRQPLPTSTNHQSPAGK